ncbi:MAG: MarR family transcriptional regulator [Anaerolineales bacterium]|nr:MarR family transcriptional regulator [Anaerolineales bacterium]
MHNEHDPIDALLGQVCRLHHLRVRTLLKDSGVHRGQPKLLFALAEEDGLTQTELVKRMQIAPATVTKMITRMEKSGFLKRKRDLKDQRVSRVYLTDAGRALKSELIEISQSIGEEVFAGFSQEERILMQRLLLVMRENLVRVTGKKSPDF